MPVRSSGSVRTFAKLRRYPKNMADELVTVFRSADRSAKSDAAAVRDRLTEAGLAAVLLDDNAPGVVEGTFEVRVPAEEVARAEELIAQGPEPEEPESEPPDMSPDLDLVTIFATSVDDSEAAAVRGVLDANGIPSVFASTPYPNLPFEVKVAKGDVARARQALAEAEAAGPAGAEEAEEASEGAV